MFRIDITCGTENSRLEDSKTYRMGWHGQDEQKLLKALEDLQKDSDEPIEKTLGRCLLTGVMYELGLKQLRELRE